MRKVKYKERYIIWCHFKDAKNAQIPRICVHRHTHICAHQYTYVKFLWQGRYVWGAGIFMWQLQGKEQLELSKKERLHFSQPIPSKNILMICGWTAYILYSWKIIAHFCKIRGEDRHHMDISVIKHFVIYTVKFYYSKPTFKILKYVHVPYLGT